ncbi:MAG TPA: carboxypeptidase regulatory-like domain-containing protein [Terriglobales bacterium]
MGLRSIVVTVLLICGLLHAQVERTSIRISGQVRNTAGQPVPDARVVVNDLMHGSTVASAYTTQNGLFDAGEVRPGDYEVVATLGTSEVRDRVDARNFDATVELRLPNAQTPSADGAVVSVSAMKVPQKARDAYDKAMKASIKGDAAAVDRYVTEALKIYPRYSDALTLRGIRELDDGHADTATNDFDAAIKADQSNWKAYLTMAAACNVMKKFDDALRSIDRATALNPNAWQGYFEAAKAYLGKADYPKALANLDHAQQFAPKDFHSIYLIKANTLVSMRRFRDAAAELQAFLQKAPSAPEAPQVRATLEKMKGFENEQ